MSIILKCRDGNITITKDYFEKYLNFEWYLSCLLKYPEINPDSDYQDISFDIFESKNAILSIFDSLKFQRLVLHENVSLDYLNALCEMWIAPDWLKSDISQRRKDKEMYDNTIYKCKNCKIGFKLSENKPNSCNCHSFCFNITHNMFQCCGKSDPNDGCIKGYHIPYIE